jgi:hypothetical protein
MGAPLQPCRRDSYERTLRDARAPLGDDAFAVAWAEGAAWSPEQAIAAALGAPTDAHLKSVPGNRQ